MKFEIGQELTTQEHSWLEISEIVLVDGETILVCIDENGGHIECSPFSVLATK